VPNRFVLVTIEEYLTGNTQSKWLLSNVSVTTANLNVLDTLTNGKG